MDSPPEQVYCERIRSGLNVVMLYISSFCVHFGISILAVPIRRHTYNIEHQSDYNNFPLFKLKPASCYTHYQVKIFISHGRFRS